MNRILLHVEGAAILILCIYVYGVHGDSWILFLVLLFTPDLSILAYGWDKRIGAIVYNVVHTFTIAVLLCLLGIILSISWIITAGLILGAHIGMDRMCGFGLKYPSGFQDTHLQKV